MSKSAPYQWAPHLPGVTEQARRWRVQLAPALAKRLPEVHLAGWRHDRVPVFVREHAASHPWFVRLDVAKFYPSLPHAVVRQQVVAAHRALFALPGESWAFARDTLPWVDALLAHSPAGVGLPLGSSMSALVAVCMWVPLALALKAQGVPFLIFADDVLLLCTSQREARERFAEVSEALHALGLQVNVAKVQSGALAQEAFSFLGWHIKGGYLGVVLRGWPALRRGCAVCARGLHQGRWLCR